MEQDLRGPESYDFRQYDQIWQRVAPTLEPYPGTAVPAMADQPQTSSPQTAVPQVPALPLQPQAASTDAENLSCPVSPVTEEKLKTLMAFIEDELSDRRYYLAFACQAPTWARRTLLDFSAEEAVHARRLMAVYYLMTGSCYNPSVSCEKIWVGPWCNALRERYHAETCGGLNYIRSAEDTADPCLSKLMTELSEEEYGHAGRILAMLQRAI